MTVKTATSPAFEALLGDLSNMAKSMGSDPEKAEVKEARKDEKHMQSGTHLAKSESERKKEEEEEEERKKKGGEKSEPMTKSFSLETKDGKQIEVVDATDLIKSFGDRLDISVEQIFATLQGCAEVIKVQGAMVKSLSDKLGGQETIISEQSTLIKSMQDTMKALESAPAGRKAVLTVAERTPQTATTTLAKSGIPEGVTPDVFFAKAFALQGAGKLTGVDIALAESCLNNGMPIPETLVNRVMI